MPRAMDTAALQEEAVRLYLAGERPTDICERLHIGRSSLYWYLRKGGVPTRADKRHQNDSTVDMIIAGLMELNELKDRRIKELEREVAALRRTLGIRDNQAPVRSGRRSAG